MNKVRIEQAILNVYAKYPDVVNNDATLLAAVWKYFGWNKFRSLEDNLNRLPRAASITRRRRILFNQGKIEYSEKADMMREEAFIKELEENSDYNWSKYER